MKSNPGTNQVIRMCGVKVPQIDATSTTDCIYMYYHNTSASDAQDATNVWDSYYKAVWHLSDASGGATDSTTTNNLTETGSLTYSQAGKAGNAVYFSGNDYLRKTSMTNPGAPVTVEFYVKPDGASPVGMFDSAPGTANVLRNYAAGEVEWHADNPQINLGMSAGAWTHLAFVYRYDTARHIDWYKDGVFQATADGNTTSTLAWSNFTIGSINSGSAGYYSGYMDEVRISNSIRSTDWIEATHLSLNDNMNSFEAEVYGSALTEATILQDNTSYHWQARVCDADNNCTDWTQFGGNDEGEVDYRTQKLVAHYSLDEATGQYIFDKSGNNHDGTRGANDNSSTDDPSWESSTNCKFNSCLTFDGSADYVNVGDIQSTIKSISFWANPATTTESLIDLDGGTHTIEMSDGTVSATGFSDPTIYINGQAGGNLVSNNWQHVMIVTDTGVSSTALSLGKVGSNYFEGFLDELRFFWGSSNSRRSTR
jgi:hypothetical protein